MPKYPKYTRGQLVFHEPTKRYGVVLKNSHEGSPSVVVNFKKVTEAQVEEAQKRARFRRERNAKTWLFWVVLETQAEIILKSDIKSPVSGVITSNFIQRFFKFTNTVRV
jgi:hypothetical protein